jgi:hypothetical protein
VKRALKAQLKAAKKVLALQKKLKKASPSQKKAIRAKIAKAKAALRKVTKKVHKVTDKLVPARGLNEGFYPAWEKRGPTYLPPMLRPKSKLSDSQKETIKARCKEVFGKQMMRA